MYLLVKVIAESKENKVVQIDANRFTVLVKEKRRFGLANKKVSELLAEFLAVNIKDLSLIKGHRESSKMFFIRDQS